MSLKQSQKFMQCLLGIVLAGFISLLFFDVKPLAVIFGGSTAAYWARHAIINNNM